jgi:hypothetical protein
LQNTVAAAARHDLQIAIDAVPSLPIWRCVNVAIIPLAIFARFQDPVPAFGRRGFRKNNLAVRAARYRGAVVSTQLHNPDGALHGFHKDVAIAFFVGQLHNPVSTGGRVYHLTVERAGGALFSLSALDRDSVHTCVAFFAGFNDSVAACSPFAIFEDQEVAVRCALQLSAGIGSFTHSRRPARLTCFVKITNAVTANALIRISR